MNKKIKYIVGLSAIIISVSAILSFQYTKATNNIDRAASGGGVFSRLENKADASTVSSTNQGVDSPDSYGVGWAWDSNNTSTPLAQIMFQRVDVTNSTTYGWQFGSQLTNVLNIQSTGQIDLLGGTGGVNKFIRAADSSGDLVNVLGVGTLEEDAVNYIEVLSGATGSGAGVTATGTDANVNLGLTAKGIGGIYAFSELFLSDATHYPINGQIWAASPSSGDLPVLQFDSEDSSVNFLIAFNGATGNSTGLMATGTDSNVNIDLEPKGTGYVNVVGRFGSEPDSDQSVQVELAVSPDRYITRIAGGGAAITVTTTPSVTAGQDGECIILQGTSDANTVTLQDESNLGGSGLALSGGADFTLGQGDTLQLCYDTGDSKYYEISRSDN